MKKVILTLSAIAGLAAGAYAQGVVSFQNQGGGIQGSIDLDNNGTLSYASSFTVALYYADVSGAATTTSLGQNQYGYLSYASFVADQSTYGLTLSDTGSELSGNPGTFNAGTATLGIAGGYSNGAYTVSDDLVLAAWTGGYSTLAAAEAAGAAYGIITFVNNIGPGGTSSAVPSLSGWNSLTPTPAVVDFEGSSNYPDLVMTTATPEPTTMALAGLGGLSMFLLRRKK